MNGFWPRRSWFLSKLTFFAYRILHSLMAWLFIIGFGNKPKPDSPSCHDEQDLPIKHMGMSSYSINILHLNRLEIELGSLSSAIAMPQDEWKRNLNPRSSLFEALNKVISIYWDH